MNFKKMSLLLLLCGVTNSGIICMDYDSMDNDGIMTCDGMGIRSMSHDLIDYNIVDPAPHRNTPTSFVAMMALHREKEAAHNRKAELLLQQKNNFDNKFIKSNLRKSSSSDSFIHFCDQQSYVEVKKNEEQAILKKWNDSQYTKSEVRSKGFFLQVTTLAEKDQKLISPISISYPRSPVAKTLPIPTRIVKGVLKKKSAYN